MKYTGKLYGKVSNTYYPLQETSEDFKKMKNRIKNLENACNNAINELELPNSSTEIAIMELKKHL